VIDTIAHMVRLILAFAGLTAVAAAQQPAYEMTTYVVGFLKKGPSWTAESTEETKKVQAGHMANIQKMADSGKLVLAGPFMDNSDIRGMFVFHGVTMDEAKAMTAEDPAIKSGRLVMEWRPWYSAKGIGILKSEAKRQEKD